MGRFPDLHASEARKCCARGNVFSAIPSSAYERASGTSMATTDVGYRKSSLRVSLTPVCVDSAREGGCCQDTHIIGTARPLTTRPRAVRRCILPRETWGAGLRLTLWRLTSSVYPTVKGCLRRCQPRRATWGWYDGLALRRRLTVTARSDLRSPPQVLSRSSTVASSQAFLGLNARGVACRTVGRPCLASVRGATVTGPRK